MKGTFLQEIIDVVKMEDVPAELIINWDQTGLNLVPASSWSMATKGSKRVELKGQNDKCQITAVFCGSLLGEFLPIQLIYGGKTKRCHPKHPFPSDWLVTHSQNHWSNEKTMISYIKEIIVPYVKRVRDTLDDHNQAALAIFDRFKGQLTDSILQLLENITFDLWLFQRPVQIASNQWIFQSIRQPSFFKISLSNMVFRTDF